MTPAMRYIFPYILFTSGSYLLLTALFPSPSGRVGKAIRRYVKKSVVRKKPAGPAGILVKKLSRVLKPFVRLNELSRVRLTNALRDSGNPATAEEYVADIVSGCLILAFFGVPFVPFYPPTAAAFVAIAAYYAIASLRDLHGSGRKKSVAIESELPRFVSYIRQSLKNNNNALLLLERYMTDNTAFSEELDRTLADIKTSNFETALLRLNSRYISEHLSMVVHGLAGVFNGDDMHHYFELLERDLTEIEINRLRREIGKIPGRMRKSMALLYAAIVIILFTPILIMIIENLRRFFT
jgi:hypothetical protein